MYKSLNSTGFRWFWIVAIVLISDLSSKLLILQSFALGETYSLVPSFNLNYVQNYGVAFGFFSSRCNWHRWFLVGISMIVNIILMILMYHTKSSQKMSNIAYSLIVGGAVSNLIDRLLHGFVIDMIDFYIGSWHFATFNLADSAICIGTFIIMLEDCLFKCIEKK